LVALRFEFATGVLKCIGREKVLQLNFGWSTAISNKPLGQQTSLRSRLALHNPVEKLVRLRFGLNRAYRNRLSRAG